MSYSKIVTYKVLPEKSYKIIRNCGGCGCKRSYVSTGEFRVNANGNRIDVWLIYQCEKCKHSYNLPIYERVRPIEIKDEYARFLANDKELAFKYGMDKALFVRNKAEIDLAEMNYDIIPLGNGVMQQSRGVDAFSKGDGIRIENPYCLKVRTDKIIAQILDFTRSKIKQLCEVGSIELDKNYLGEITQVMIRNEIV